MRRGIVIDKIQNLYVVQDFDKKIPKYRNIENFSGLNVEVGEIVSLGFFHGNLNDAVIIGVKKTFEN